MSENYLKFTWKLKEKNIISSKIIMGLEKWEIDLKLL